MLEFFAQDPDMAAVMPDSTAVRAHMCAAGGSKKGAPARQCLGRNQGGFSGKIHLLVDALGFPLQLILTGGERHDLSQAESLLAPFHFDAAIADKDYSSDLLGELVTARQVEAFIPSSRLSQATARDNDRLRYRKRNIAERFINRTKWFRRIFTRNEKLPRRFPAFLHISASLTWHERNVNRLSTGGVAGVVAPHKGGPERPDRPTAVASGQWPVVRGQGLQRTAMTRLSYSAEQTNC